MSTPDDGDDARVIGGRYRLDRTIGSGGMGTVWEGVDELLGRAVAVKEVRFPPEVGEREQAELRERTLREARATARLSHPHVVTTYDVVEENGRPYIVMELLPTRSLAAVLREDGPLPPHRVAQIGLGMLGALETSHAQGIVHRDVKPGNVLITDDGRAVLTDFGIATMAGDPSLTSTGVVLGSPAYMSPERARGRKPGAEADLWSLGATLYAAVEGRPPYDADNALETLTAVISEPVTPPKVGGPLGEAITGLLAKEPAERMDIATATALLRQAEADHSAAPAVVPAATTVALDRAGRTEALQPVTPVAAAPPPRDGEPAYVREERRPRGLLLAALLVALAVIVGLTAFALTSGDPDTKADPKGSQSANPPETSESSSPESPSPDDTTPTTETTPPETTPEEGGVPAGFTTYSDETGFSLAIPEGWRVRARNGLAVDLSAGDTGPFLRIDQRSDPQGDPAADWERQEQSVQARLPNYQRLRIESVEYNGWPAADWEFTFGNNTHVLNRGFVPSDTQAYAIYASSSETEWQQTFRIFQTAADTFTPAGASGGDEDDD